MLYGSPSPFLVFRRTLLFGASFLLAWTQVLTVSVHEEPRFVFTFVQKQVGQHLACSYTCALSLYVYVHISIFLQLILRGCMLKSLAVQRFMGPSEIACLNPAKFPAKSSVKVGSASGDARLIIGVKIQRRCKGQGLGTLCRKLSVANKLLINLDLEGEGRVSLL